MTFKKASLPAAIAFLALFHSAAAAATLRSLDDGFSLNVPGKWQDAESADPVSVLLARKGREEIKIRALPEPVSDKALMAKLQATRKKLKKGGVSVPARISSAATGEGGKVFFIQFTSKGKRFHSGFFNAGGMSYGFLLTGLSNSEFKALAGSLASLPETEGPGTEARVEPAGRTSAPAAAAAPSAAELPAPPPTADTLAPGTPPAASTDTLAAPPADAAFAAGGTTREPADLPPLPKRNVGGSLFLVLVAVVLSAAALGYRAFSGKAREVPEIKPVPGAIFPYRVEKRYLSFPLVFDIQDAAGQQYRAVSYRVPALMLSSGLVIYFLMKALVQLLTFAGVEQSRVPVPVMMGIVGLMSLSSFLILGGVVLGLFFRKKLKLYDPSGNILMDVCEKRMTFASQYFLIRDPAGNEVGKMKRVGFFFVRRHWQLLGGGDKVLLDIREDSAGRAIARRLLGHLWGLLRTSYIISDENGREIGGLTRDWSIWNRFTLDVQGLNSIQDPRLVMATSLFVDIIDPDRWYPWHG